MIFRGPVQESQLNIKNRTWLEKKHLLDIFSHGSSCKLFFQQILLGRNFIWILSNPHPLKNNFPSLINTLPKTSRKTCAYMGIRFYFMSVRF